MKISYIHPIGLRNGSTSRIGVSLVFIAQMCFFVSKETQPSKLYTEVIWSFKELREKKIMVKVIRLLTYKSIIALQLANYNFHPQIQQTFLQNQREHIRLTSCFHAGPSPWRRTKRRILRYKLNLLRSGHWQVKLLENALCFGWCNVFLQVFYKHISIGL